MYQSLIMLTNIRTYISNQSFLKNLTEELTTAFEEILAGSVLSVATIDRFIQESVDMDRVPLPDQMEYATKITR